MEGTYPVLLGTQTVGEIRVQRQGLYYCFHCRCSLSGELIYRLAVTCGGKTENLGLPVPEGDHFVLRTKLPVKRFAQGSAEFRILPKHGDLKEEFVPICPEEPFRYLSRLQNAYLQRRGDIMGIVVKSP